MEQGTFSKDQLKAFKETLVQLLNDSGFDNQVKIMKTSVNGYKSKNLIHSHNFVAASSLKANQKENLAIFNKLKEETLKNLKEQGKEKISDAIEELNFTIGYSKGDKIQTMSGLEKIEFDNAGGNTVTDIEFKVEEGVVTLIDFWATWCGPCQAPMAHNESMLKTNEEKWKGKATIVGLSLDDESEGPIKRITEKDWKRVQHYRFKNGWDEENDDLKMFEINGIPFVVLLDKKGKIVFKGHPSECKLEEEINRLIDQEDVISQENDEDQNTLSQKEMIQKSYQKQTKLFFQDQWKQQISVVDEIDGHFNILLEKSYTFSKDGVKNKMEYKKLAVNYKVGIQQKDWALSAVNLIKQTLNPESVSFELEIIDDPYTDLQNHLSFFKSIMETNNLPITLVENKTSKLEYSEGQFKETEISIFAQSEQLSSSLKDTITKVNAELKQYFEKNAQRNVNKFEKIFKTGLTAQLDVNSQFAEICNLHSLGKTETVSLIHEEGKVLVVDFWAQWCGPCVSGLKKNTLLLQSKEEAWKGKVRFVAICLEDEKSSKEFLDMNTESQKQIEFMFMNDGRQNPAPTLYQVQYIPHYVIVGKNGTVRALGSCSNLEETVQKLIDEESKGDLQSKEKDEKFSTNQIDLLEELIKDKIHFVQVGENLKQVPFQFKLYVKKQSKLNLQTLKFQFKQIEEIGIQMWIRESNQAIIQGTLDKIYSIVPKEDLIQKIEIMKTFDIPFPGDKCQLCSQTLNDQTPQYYSHFSKEFYCVECTEQDNKEEIGLARYKVKDSVVFINAPLKDLSVVKDIDEYKFGKNLKIKEGEAGSQQHGFSCNGCGGSGEPGPRYIALSCRRGPPQNGGYVDFCFGCLRVWSQKTTNEAQKIIKENQNENLSEDTTWLRVLFSHGYYDF